MGQDLKYLWRRYNFKATKLQTYIGQFEQLKMKEDEDIATCFLRVGETLNAIIGLGEEIEEERLDLNSISMDEMHGIFTAYEMRTEHEKPDVKEAAFKPSKRSK